MKKILIVLVMLVSLNVYAESIEDKDINYNFEYHYNFDTKAFDKFLNYGNFKVEFNKIYGERTGVPITMIIDENDFDFDNLSNHGYNMYIVSNRVKISDDVKYLFSSLKDKNSVADFTKNIYYFINTYKNNNIKVINESNGAVNYNRLNTDLIPEMKKNDILFIQGAGNEQSHYSNYTQYLNNTIDDNLLVIAALSYTYKVDPVDNINKLAAVTSFGNDPVADFSVYALVLYDYNPKSSGISGTSAATMIASTIITQYYTIRPCWNYKNMVKFIYSILRPTSELGITDDKTKTKSYLTYSNLIFDDKYVNSLDLPVCGGISSSDNSTNVLTDNATIMLLEKFKK